MANSLAVQTSIFAQLDKFNLGGNSSVNIALTGNNGIGASQEATTGAWTQLNTSLLSDLRAAWFYNDTVLTGVITIASGSNGEHVLTVLNPGESSLIAWSGSIGSLYVKATGVDSLVQYVLVES